MKVLADFHQIPTAFLLLSSPPPLGSVSPWSPQRKIIYMGLSYINMILMLKNPLKPSL